MKRTKIRAAVLPALAALLLCAASASAETLKFTGSPGFLLSPIMVVGVYTPEENTNFATFHRGGVVSSGADGGEMRVAFGINNSERSYTYRCLKASGACTINLPSVKYMSEAALFGHFSGRPLSGDAPLLPANGGYQDKLAPTGLTARKGEAVNAPMIEEFPISLECEFEDEVAVSGGRPNRLMILKVKKVWADEAYIDAGGKINPLNGAADSSIVFYSNSTSASGGFYGYGEFVGKSGEVSKPYKDDKPGHGGGSSSGCNAGAGALALLALAPLALRRKK